LFRDVPTARSAAPRSDLAHENSLLAPCSLVVARSGSIYSADARTGLKDLDMHTARQGLGSPCLRDQATASPSRSCVGCRWHLSIAQSVTVEQAQVLVVARWHSLLDAT